MPDIPRASAAREPRVSERAAGWSLVGEFGLDYATPARPAALSPLVQPASAERDDDGTYVIVDETYAGKYLAQSTECYTMRVDPDGRVLYDTRATGIPDGYGCLAGGGDLAIIGRARSELAIVAADGRPRRIIELSRLTKGMPWLVSRTPRGSLLVLSRVRGGAADVVELSPDGELLWALPRAFRGRLGSPGSVEMLADGNLLVADERRHVLVELRRDGEIVWRHGVAGDPSAQPGRLANPKSVRAIDARRRIVADTRNHRVLVLGPGPEVTEVRPTDGPLWSPTFACALPDGHVLVCDAGNRRVVELDADGATAWQYGTRIASQRRFTFPRSVEAIGGGYAVADTGNDRVVEVTAGRMRVVASRETAGLFWPRCARPLPHGGYLVADARNARIVEIAAGGAILRELRAESLPEEARMRDPHDVSAVGDDRLLIVDSATDLVLLCDWSGRVRRVVGRDGDARLADPHGGRLLDTGEVMIADTGNERIVWVDEKGRVTRELESLSDGVRRRRLARPRYATLAADGTLVIADSDNNRVLAARPDGALLWEIDEIPGSPMPSLHQPRWVQATDRNEVLVSDHHHHRIVHLRRRPGG